METPHPLVRQRTIHLPVTLKEPGLADADATVKLELCTDGTVLWEELDGPTIWDCPNSPRMLL